MTVVNDLFAVLRGVADHPSKVDLIAYPLLASDNEAIDRLTVPLRLIAITNRLAELATQSHVVAMPATLPVAQRERSKADVDPSILCLGVKLNRLLCGHQRLFVARLVDKAYR